MFCESTSCVASMMLSIVAVPVMPGPVTFMPAVSPLVLGTVIVVVLTVVLVDSNSWVRPSTWL